MVKQLPAQMTPDLLVLGRMLWGSQDDAMTLADLVDPAVFQTRPTRQLFLLFSREAPKGFSPVTLRALVGSELPDCNPLFEELLARLGSEAMDDSASIEAVAEAAAKWGQVTRLGRAVANARSSLDAGESYDNVRSILDRQLTAIDLSAIAAKCYDDKADMARRIDAFLSGEGPTGTPFGFRQLDRIVTPMLDGNFIIVAGRSGTGKSTVMRNVARNCVVNYEQPTAYFSFEMAGEEKLPLFACMETGISYPDYIRGRLGTMEVKLFREAIARWVQNPLFILNERSDVTPEWILRTMKRYRALGIKKYVLDHLHRVRYEKSEKGDVRLPMGDFARALKSFAVDHGATVIAGCQFTKGDKHEEPHEGMIRETGTIADEADLILMPWPALVEGIRTGEGEFVPRVTEKGHRIFAANAQDGAELGEDPERIYLQVGKQRIREHDGLAAVPFRRSSGLMYEETTRYVAAGAAA
jgi:replicative DNA helicase